MRQATSRGIAAALLTIAAAMIPSLSALAASAHQEAAPTARSGTVVAKVNGQPIYEDQLEPQIRAQLRDFGKFGARKPSDEMMRRWKRQALDRLIGVELLRQASKDLPIPDMDRRIDEKRAEMRMQQASGPKGMDETGMRESITRQIRVQEYLEKNHLLAPEIPEGQIQEYYEQNKQAFASRGSYRVRQISCDFDPDGTDAERRDARRLIEQARQLILDGKPFEEVAIQYPQCRPETAGADLSPREKGSLPQELEAVVFSLDPGKLSPVIETRDGYHILEVLERTPEGTIPPYAQTRDFIAGLLGKQASPRRIATHVQELRDKAAVEVFLQ